LLPTDEDQEELELLMKPAITDPRHDQPMTVAIPRAPSQMPDSSWHDRFGQAVAAELSRRPARRRVAFWLLASVSAAGSVTQVAQSRLSSRRVVLAGLGLFLAALALILTALVRAGMGLFLAGTVVGGVAVGAIFLGSLATTNRLAPPKRRGHAISAFSVACYAGLIIPVDGDGVLSGFTGTFPAVLAFSLLLAVLCLFSLARTATALASDRAVGQ
jgi:MFS family permease